MKKSLTIRELKIARDAAKVYAPGYGWELVDFASRP